VLLCFSIRASAELTLRSMTLVQTSAFAFAHCHAARSRSMVGMSSLSGSARGSTMWPISWSAVT
jgi:hypothetical protein